MRSGGRRAVLDLDYAEDSGAEADANFVLTDPGGIVEIQGTAEQAPFSEAQFGELMALAGITARPCTRLHGRSGARTPRRIDPGQADAPGCARPSWSWPATTRASWREIEALVAPLGMAVVLGREPGPAGAGRGRRPTSPATRGSRRWPPRRGAGMPALADDSGFCVAALGGAPGVLSARWAGPGKDFGAAMARVRDGTGGRGRPAGLVRVARCAWPGRTGTRTRSWAAWTARWRWPPRGARGFGYDPMFVPAGSVRRAIGEIERRSEKNAIQPPRAGLRAAAGRVLRPEQACDGPSHGWPDAHR